MCSWRTVQCHRPGAISFTAPDSSGRALWSVALHDPGNRAGRGRRSEPRRPRPARLPGSCNATLQSARPLLSGAVKEIAPGLWHWTVRHEHIHVNVSSYYLLEERVLIDPMVPAEGLDWFEQHGAPEHVLLTNRHHDRHAWRLREAFGCSVH